MLIKVIHVGSRPGSLRPKDGSLTWIDYWKKYSKKAVGDMCPDCKRLYRVENRPVGAHVKKSGSLDNNYYIVPVCVDCNRTATLDKHSFYVEEDRLVKADIVRI